MKKTLVCLFSAGIVLLLASCAQKFDGSKFPAWFTTDAQWRTIAKFVDDSAKAPTAAQIDSIMNMVTKSVTSGGQQDMFFLVLTDEAQQAVVTNPKNAGAANKGTITVLVFGDRLLNADVRANPINRALDRGYYDTGIATGYLNVAAISLGFGTHMFMTPNGSITAMPGWTRITDDGVPGLMEEYFLKDKGYTYKRESVKDNVVQTTEFPAYGNVKFVCAVVIGTPDTSVNTEVSPSGPVKAGQTSHIFPANWATAQ